MREERARCEPIGTQRHVLAETPAWCAASGALWWIDVRGPTLFRWDGRAAEPEAWPLADVVGGAAVADDGRVVVALRDSLAVFDAADATLTPLVRVEPARAEHRLNELKTDPQGCLWCGSMRDYGAATAGSLYRIDTSLAVRTVRTNITIPNGMAFTPDGAGMVFVDTGEGVIEAAAWDAVSGLPGTWRPHVAAGVAPGRPDGDAFDADGCLWSARFGAGCIARFTPEGRLDRLVSLPATQVTSLAFGGAHLDTLFVTTGTQRLSAEALRAEPLAGALLALSVGVRGAPVAPAVLPARPRPSPVTGVAA
ncbi:MAG: SMP-30/gluconolactonase/LRE family protein [Burkholderiales bacterium]|nr:SMP-30/gluconolactonase/LRE family protein [Burkholderiales bacterium]